MEVAGAVQSAPASTKQVLMKKGVIAASVLLTISSSAYVCEALSVSYQKSTAVHALTTGIVSSESLVAEKGTSSISEMLTGNCALDDDKKEALAAEIASANIDTASPNVKVIDHNTTEVCLNTESGYTVTITLVKKNGETTVSSATVSPTSVEHGANKTELLRLADEQAQSTYATVIKSIDDDAISEVIGKAAADDCGSAIEVHSGITFLLPSAFEKQDISDAATAVASDSNDESSDSSKVSTGKLLSTMLAWRTDEGATMTIREAEIESSSSMSKEEYTTKLMKAWEDTTAEIAGGKAISSFATKSAAPTSAALQQSTANTAASGSDGASQEKMIQFDDALFYVKDANVWGYRSYCVVDGDDGEHTIHARITMIDFVNGTTSSISYRSTYKDEEPAEEQDGEQQADEAQSQESTASFDGSRMSSDDIWNLLITTPGYKPQYRPKVISVKGKQITQIPDTIGQGVAAVNAVSAQNALLMNVGGN